MKKNDNMDQTEETARVLVSMDIRAWNDMLRGRKKLYTAASAPQSLYGGEEHTCYVWVPELSIVAGYFISDSAMQFSAEDLMSEPLLNSICYAACMPEHELKAAGGPCVCWRVLECRAETKTLEQLGCTLPPVHWVKLKGGVL